MAAAGAAPPAALAVSLAVVLVAAYILAWIYGPLDHYSPLVLLNILIAYGMGSAMGRLGASLMRVLKINGVGAGTLIGAAAGIASAWFGWTTYLWTITNYNWDFYWTLFANPAALWETVNYLAGHPIWTLSKGAGGQWPALYYAAWLGEFLILTGTPIRRCRAFAASHLLCRRCSAWLRETGDAAFFVVPSDWRLHPRTPSSPAESLALFAVPDGQAFQETLAKGEVASLAGCKRRAPGDPAGREPDAWLEVKGFACPNCAEEDSYVKAALMSLAWDSKKKKLELHQQPISGFIPVDVETEGRIFAAPPAATNPDDVLEQVGASGGQTAPE